MIALETQSTFCHTIDRMKKENNALLQGLLDSKKECLEYLSDCFASAIVECFQRMYKDCLSKPEYKSGKNILVLFQHQLAGVAGWNQSLVMDEYKMAMDKACCTYIPSLIRTTLIVYVKVHLLTNYSSIDIDKIKLRVPSAETFYHRCLIICASEIWRQPYLFYHKVRSIEQQHNLNEVESMAKKSIKNAIRVFIPIDQILSNIQMLSLATTSEVHCEEPSKSSDESEEEQQDDDDCESEADQEDYDSESKEDNDAGESEGDQEDDDEQVVQEPIIESEHEEDRIAVGENDDKEDENTSNIPSPSPSFKTVTFDEHAQAPDDTMCSVDKMFKEDVEPEPEPQHVTKKIILGSMLINKHNIKKRKMKLMKPVKLGKSDAFF